MNNLTTRKIVLGLLMTLVLAFGVLGVVDAIMDPTIAESALNPTDLYDVGGTASIDSISINPDKADTKETVSISKSSGITLTGEFYGLSRVSLKEVDEDLTDADEGSSFTYTRDGRTQTISGTATGDIGITFTAKGKQTVTISGTDNDGDNKGSWSYKYTYYVKGPGTSTTTISLVGLSNGYKAGIFSGTAHRIPIHNGDGSHYDVTYTTIPDDAMAQIETTAGALGTLEPLDDKNTSSVFDVLLQADGTYQVTATVKDSKRETIGVYIIGTPTLTVGHPGDPNGIGTGTITEDSGAKTEPGRLNKTLDNAFKVRITDGAIAEIPAIDLTNAQLAGAVPGVVVTFRVGGGGDAGGYLVFDSSNQGTLVYRDNRKILDTNDQPVTMDTAKILYVRTDEDGQADVDFQLGTDRKQDVTISAVGQSKVVSAYAGAAVSGNQLVNPESKSSQASGHAGEYELRVKAVDEDGEGLPGERVEFRTSDGTLDDPVDVTVPTTIGRLPVSTDTQGVAFVFFDPTDGSGSPRVTAHLIAPGVDGDIGTTDDTVVDDVVFDISGVSNQQQQQQQQQQQTNTITISPSTITGAPGETVTITISNPVGVAVSLSSPNSGFPESNFSPATGSATSFTSTVTLPSTDGTYTIFAVGTIGGTTVSDTATVTVETTALGTLTVSKDGAQIGTQQQILVRASPAPSSNLPFTVTSGRFRVGGGEITTAGTGRAVISVPTASGLYTLTVSAEGYNPRPVTFTAGTQTTDTTDTTTDPTVPIDEPPIGEPDSISISGPAARSGAVNYALDTPLLVRVLDDAGTGVADARVIFRVTSGRGRLSQRGNGRAIGVQTDTNGYARANLTPLGDGKITVQASATGVSRAVEFTITTDDGTPVDDGTPIDDRPAGTTVNPVVHVGAASRPPMLWVDGGFIYALVGANIQKFVETDEFVNAIAVGNGKVYWTEVTGGSSGTINSANLNGTGVKELKAIRSAPMGITVDTTGHKLYWTASSGKIKRANLDGSGSENVMQNLSDPVGIGLAGGNAYWTEGDPGSVRFVNLRGQKVVRDISTGPGIPGSLATGGGKVYWTERTGEQGGTINSANLNGTGVKQLASTMSVPIGIAVDTARSRVYWTSSSGKVKSANLNGGNPQKVVDGLGSPGELVLSNSIAETPATTTTTTTASRSKYDVNKDGTVDNTDASLVAAAMGTNTDKYDVNDDGTVNFLDLLLVFDNRDPGAAGAPTLVGMQLSVVQINVIQEQIDLLIATNDRSPAALRTLVYLQQLLVTARPEKTQLLANYPNPFNPETWIPYELATDTNVRITIYNAQGVVIRTLWLGQQSAGYYTDRERAAYWDGRNALGEQVASGIYFYQFETDEMSSMRKMVILK